MFENKSIVEIPNIRSGVYAILNICEMKVYVGETNDFNYRTVEHLMGIYSSGDKTNKNLQKESNKSFDFFTVIHCNYYDKSNKSVKQWLIDESIVMYVFRKYGFTLYNGDENYQDNLSDKRAFLINPDCSIYDNVKLNHLIENLNGSKTDWNTKCEKAEKEINKLLKEKYFFDNYDIINPLEDFFLPLSKKDLFLSKKEREALWKKRLDSYSSKLKSEKNSKSLIKSLPFVYDESTCIKLCNKIVTSFLSIDDMENCGIEKMEIAELVELIKAGEFDRAVFHKFGFYIEQSPITILSVKNFDLKGLPNEDGNKLSNLNLVINDEMKDKKICFWALQKLNLELTKKFLSENESTAKTRYVIMPFTVSKGQYKKEDLLPAPQYYSTSQNITVGRNDLNPQDGENISDFYKRLSDIFDKTKNQVDIDLKSYPFAYGFYKSESDFKNKVKEFSIPRGMFPPIIDKFAKKTEKSSNALLISELRYINADYDSLDELYKCYYAIQGKVKSSYKQNLDYSLGIKGSRNLHNKEKVRESTKNTSYSMCPIQLKGEEERKNLIEFLKNNCKQNSATSAFIIAKIEYPYIIKLANEIK